ncbi:MAG: S41 family peptidase [Bacteroidota bacterium]
MRFHLLLLTLFISLSSFSQSKTNSNLESFSKLYGYIRYFHPSDEAAAVDWDKFLYYGIEQINNSKQGNDLQNTLEALFLPIAPTLQIYKANNTPKIMSLPTKSEESVLVTWQHKGFEHSERNIYRSVRLGRINLNKEPAHGISIYPDLGDLSGKKFKLSLKGKATPNSKMQIQLVTYTRSRKTNRYKLLIDSEEWKDFELEDTFEEGTMRSYLTIQMLGLGEAWIDEVKVELEEENGWTEVVIENTDFDGTKADGTPKYWEVDGFGYNYLVKENALQIKNIEGYQAGSVFSHHAKADEFFTADLGNGFKARFPLALYLPKEMLTTFSPAHQALMQKLDSIALETLSAGNMTTRLGATITAWNVLQHSYPYFDVVEVDWDEMLSITLERMLKTKSQEESIVVLRKMMAKLQDGHVFVSHTSMRNLAPLPVLLDYVEDQIIILASKENQLQAGDILVEIDGQSASELLNQQTELHSGTLQWRRYRALGEITLGERERSSILKIRRGDEHLEIEVTRGERAPSSTRPDSIVHLDNTIFYINLDAIRMSNIEEQIEELAEAKGVIFDMRGYPRGNHNVISYMIDRPVQSAKWKVPQIIYPDMENTPAYDTSGRWTIEPKLPKLEGKIVFITGGSAISYAESFMGIIEHYKLAEIIGSATAGTNGNVNPFPTMGGFRFSWTGMKVVKQDDSQHHLVGIQPTVPMKPTIQGIREGKDELLEKAIELIMEK